MKVATLPNLGNIHPLDKGVTYPFDEAYPAEGKVEILLASLPWNETNLPAFSSKNELDAFLDGLDGTKKIRLDQFENKPPAFTVPLGLSYTTALPYTYMRVRLVQPAPDLPLPGTNPAAKIDFYYFIQAINYRNPSTTYFDLTLDVWHTFFDDIEIVGDLKRGHLINELAPTPAEYLSNPIANTGYITAPDFNLGDPGDLYASTTIEQFGGNTERYLVLFANIEPENLLLFLRPSEQVPFPPTYAADGAPTSLGRWTHVDYNEVSPVPYAPNAEGNGTPAGLYAYALKMSQAPEIISALDSQGQHILNRIMAAAVLPASLIRLGSKVATPFGDFYPLTMPRDPLSRLVTHTLTPEQWDMPESIKAFTKAYTYPYAHISLTMPDGTNRPIQIETLGDKGISYTERICTAFPWLSAEVYLETYKSSDVEALEWRTLDNKTAQTTLPAGAWQESLARWEIPTFTLWRTSYAAYRADNQGAIAAAKDSAGAAYASTWRGAQTSYANTVDAAETSYTNAANAANTAYANTVAATSTSVANQTVSNKTATANKEDQNVMISDNRNNEMGKQYNTMSYQRIKSLLDNISDTSFMLLTTIIENEKLSDTTTAQGLSGMAGGAISGAVTGAAVGGPLGAAVGGVAGALGGAAQWAAAEYISGITIDANNAIVEARIENNAAHFRSVFGGGYYNDLEFNNNLMYTSENVRIAQDFNNVITDRNNASTMSIAQNNKATTDANAARSRDASVTNAANTRTTTDSNAARSRDAAIENAQRSQLAAYGNNQNAYGGAAIGPNIAQTQNGGMAALDVLAERNVTISHVTQSKDALDQLAQLWRRYGYSFGGRTPRPLTPATSTAQTSAPCTFWQIEDITFKKPLLKIWQDQISELLAEGITFWKNPHFTQIGA